MIALIKVFISWFFCDNDWIYWNYYDDDWVTISVICSMIRFILVSDYWIYCDDD